MALYTGFENNDDELHAGPDSSGPDRFEGFSGNDTLTNDSDGDDTMVGGPGSDLMQQTGTGAREWLLSLGDGQDEIRNFRDPATDEGQDWVRFTNAWITDIDAFFPQDEDLYIQYGSGDQVVLRSILWPDQRLLLSFADGVVVDGFVFGGDGDEEVDGYTVAAGDAMHGGADAMVGLAGKDTLRGFTGDDLYLVDDTGDVVVEAAGGGNDTVLSFVSYTIPTQVERLALGGDAAIDATGNAGANRLSGNGGANVLTGGAGNDTYDVQNAGDKVVELEDGGFDIVRSTVSHAIAAHVESLALTGSAAINGVGNAMANRLTGNPGNNILNGKGGDDTMVGGNGDDTYHVDAAGDSVVETNASATGGIDTVYSALAAYTLGATIENGRILHTGTASITGNALDNVLFAGAGDNVLDGGAGVNTVSYQSGLAGAAGVTVALVGTAQATGGSGMDRFIAIANLTGSNAADQLTGNTGANVLQGGHGNDTLFGLAGKDALDGQGGTDSLVGGDGDDTYTVDSAADVVSEAGTDTAGVDQVNSRLTAYTLGANIENGRILHSGTAGITGNSLGNLLFAGLGDNVIDGLGGVDTVSYRDASTEGVWVDLAKTAAQFTFSSGLDTLRNIERVNGSVHDDSLRGNGGHNVLRGDAGDDDLYGAAGNDTLVGGPGADTLSGNAGADTFDYNALAEIPASLEDTDAIIDFEHDVDRIDLAGLDANTATTADDAFTVLIAGNAAFTAPGQLRLTDGVLWGNVDADAAPELAIDLLGSPFDLGDLVL